MHFSSSHSFSFGTHPSLASFTYLPREPPPILFFLYDLSAKNQKVVLQLNVPLKEAERRGHLSLKLALIEHLEPQLQAHYLASWNLKYFQ